MTLRTKRAGNAPDVIAPDGSEVRVLCATPRGGMALFTLRTGTVSRAIAHRTVEEIWYVISGRGRMWRKLGEQEEVVDLVAGLSLTIPVGVWFQFRSDGPEPLVAVGATMPPWPGGDEVVFVAGIWDVERAAD